MSLMSLTPQPAVLGDAEDRVVVIEGQVCPAAVTVAVAPPVSILPPALTLTTVVPVKVVVSVPAVAWLAASQVTLAVFSPGQAASALCG